MSDEIRTQLAKLNGEIDAVNVEIKAKEQKWEEAKGDDKAFYKESIADLKEKEKTLNAQREKLTDKLSGGGLQDDSKVTSMWEEVKKQLEEQKKMAEEQNRVLGGKLEEQNRVLGGKLEEQNSKLEKLAQRATSIIDDDTRKKIQGAVFSLSTTKKFEPIGVCFFVAPTVAVTCWHNLAGETVVKKKIGDIVWAVNTHNKKVEFTISFMSEKYDFAILKTKQVMPVHLTLLDTSASQPGIGSQFIMAAYQIGIKEDLPEFSLSVGVSQGTITKVSLHSNYFLYQATTWSGDSGGALTLIGGNVIGMHLAGVNEARRRIEQSSLEDSVKDSNQSLDALIDNTASGAVGLFAHVVLSNGFRATTGKGEEKEGVSN